MVVPGSSRRYHFSQRLTPNTAAGCPTYYILNTTYYVCIICTHIVTGNRLRGEITFRFCQRKVERVSKQVNKTYHCITPPCGSFPSPIARQPRMCQDRTTRLRKALGKMLTTPTFVVPYDTDTFPTAVEISTMEHRPRGV